MDDGRRRGVRRGGARQHGQWSNDVGRIGPPGQQMQVVAEPYQALTNMTSRNPKSAQSSWTVRNPQNRRHAPLPVVLSKYRSMETTVVRPVRRGGGVAFRNRGNPKTLPVREQEVGDRLLGLDIPSPVDAV